MTLLSSRAKRGICFSLTAMAFATPLVAQTVDDATDLFLVDGAGHTFGARHPWAGSNPALEQVVSRTVDWCARHVA